MHRTDTLRSPLGFATLASAIALTASALAPAQAEAQGPGYPTLSWVGSAEAPEPSSALSRGEELSDLSSTGPAALTLLSAPLALGGIGTFLVAGAHALIGPPDDLELGLTFGGLAVGILGVIGTIVGAVSWARTDRRRRRVERGLTPEPTLAPMMSTDASGNLTGAGLELRGAF